MLYISKYDDSLPYPLNAINYKEHFIHYISVMLNQRVSQNPSSPSQQLLNNGVTLLRQSAVFLTAVKLSAVVVLASITLKQLITESKGFLLTGWSDGK